MPNRRKRTCIICLHLLGPLDLAGRATTSEWPETRRTSVKACSALPAIRRWRAVVQFRGDFNVHVRFF